MRTILFMDDWAVYRSARMKRRWFTAEPWPGLEPQQDKLLKYSFGGPVVIREPDTQRWRMWAGGMIRTDIGDSGMGSYIYQSDDGLRWEPDTAGNTGSEPAHLVRSEGEYTGGGTPFYDERETDPQKRYKGIATLHQGPGARRWRWFLRLTRGRRR